MKKVHLSIIVIVLGVSVSAAGILLAQNRKLFSPDTGNKPSATAGSKTPATSGSKNPAAAGSNTPATAGSPSQNSNAGKQPDQKPAENGSTVENNNKPPATAGGRVDSPSGDDSAPPKTDMTVYSWWFRRNSDHRPPQIDQGIARMIAGKGYYLGNTSQNKVYLTFDEGYENGFTPAILDILKQNGVSAAFFVTADFVDKNPDLVKRMAAEGHIIGNHSTTHPSLPKLTNEEIIKEIRITHDKVKALTGQDMTFFRPPMGEYNSRVLDIIKGQGYRTVFWSMAYRDWEVDNQPGREVAYKHVMDNIHPGAIILLHAVSKSNTEALDDIIKGVKAKGYTFDTLNNLY